MSAVVFALPWFALPCIGVAFFFETTVVVIGAFLHKTTGI
jgi:hypothetical protein